MIDKNIQHFEESQRTQIVSDALEIDLLEGYYATSVL